MRGTCLRALKLFFSVFVALCFCSVLCISSFQSSTVFDLLFSFRTSRGPFLPLLRMLNFRNHSSRGGQVTTPRRAFPPPRNNFRMTPCPACQNHPSPAQGRGGKKHLRSVCVMQSCFKTCAYCKRSHCPLQRFGSSIHYIRSISTGSRSLWSLMRSPSALPYSVLMGALATSILIGDGSSDFPPESQSAHSRPSYIYLSNEYCTPEFIIVF